MDAFNLLQQELKIALDLHARVEELHVYPVFQRSEITRDSAAKALEGHRKMKVLLANAPCGPTNIRMQAPS